MSGTTGAQGQGGGPHEIHVPNPNVIVGPQQPGISDKQGKGSPQSPPTGPGAASWWKDSGEIKDYQSSQTGAAGKGTGSEEVQDGSRGIVVNGEVLATKNQAFFVLGKALDYLDASYNWAASNQTSYVNDPNNPNIPMPTSLASSPEVIQATRSPEAKQQWFGGMFVAFIIAYAQALIAQKGAVNAERRLTVAMMNAEWESAKASADAAYNSAYQQSMIYAFQAAAGFASAAAGFLTARQMYRNRSQKNVEKDMENDPQMQKTNKDIKAATKERDDAKALVNNAKKTTPSGEMANKTELRNKKAAEDKANQDKLDEKQEKLDKLEEKKERMIQDRQMQSTQFLNTMFQATQAGFDAVAKAASAYYEMQKGIYDAELQLQQGLSKVWQDAAQSSQQGAQRAQSLIDSLIQTWMQQSGTQTTQSKMGISG